MTKRILSALLAVLLCLGLLPVAASAAAASTTVELFTETLTGVTVTYDAAHSPANGYRTDTDEWAWNNVTAADTITLILQPNAGTAFFTAPTLACENCQSTPTVDVAATDNGWYRFTVSNLVGDGTTPVKLAFVGSTETVYTATLVTEELIGATATLNATVVKANESVKLTVTPNEGYALPEPPTVTLHALIGENASWIASRELLSDGNDEWYGYIYLLNGTVITLSGSATERSDENTFVHRHPICGLVCTHTPAHEPIDFAPFTVPADRILPGGAYALTDDTDLTGVINLASKAEITLCLGDYTLTGTPTGMPNRNGLLVCEHGEITLNLCAHESGKISGVRGTAIHVYKNGARLNLYGGTITGNDCGIEASGFVDLYNGDIVIDGNGRDGKACNLLLEDDHVLNIKEGLSQNTRIGISMSSPGHFARNNGAKVTHFFSDDPAYTVELEGNGRFSLVPVKPLYTAIPGSGSSGGSASFTPGDGVTLPEGTDLIAAPYTPTPDLIADIIDIERPLDPLAITPDVVETLSPEELIGRYFDQEVRLGSVITYEGEEYLIRSIYNKMKMNWGQQYWAESWLYGSRLTDGAQLDIKYNVKGDRIKRADVVDANGICPEKAERQLIIGGVTYLQTYRFQLDVLVYYFTTLDGTPAGYYDVADGKYTVWFYPDCAPERLSPTQPDSDGNVHMIDDSTAIVIGRDGYKQVKVLAAADITLVDQTGQSLPTTDTKGTVQLILEQLDFTDRDSVEYHAVHIESETKSSDGYITTSDGLVVCIFPVTAFSPFIVLAVTDYHPGALPEVDIPEPEPEPMFSFTQLIPIYRLRFETGGGNPIATQLRMLSNKVDLTRITPKRDGYTFTGWYADPALTEKITETFRMRGNKTVYAGWIETAEP